MTAVRLNPGEPAIDFTLPRAATGEPLTLSRLRGRPVVLLFYRGPWCGVCQQHLGKVRKRYPEIKESGAEVVAVFPGRVAYLQAYAREKKFPFPLVVDETGATIEAYGIKNRWALIHRGIPHPAAYVLDRDGVVRFADVRAQHFFRVPVGTLVAEVARLKAVDLLERH